MSEERLNKMFDEIKNYSLRDIIENLDERDEPKEVEFIKKDTKYNLDTDLIANKQKQLIDENYDEIDL